MLFVKRTRATFRRAEFGFFGVCVYTRVHTPRFCGLEFNAGLEVLYLTLTLPLRTNWLSVGTDDSFVRARAEDASGIVTGKRIPSRRTEAQNDLGAPGHPPIGQVCLQLCWGCSEKLLRIRPPQAKLLCGVISGQLSFEFENPG